MDVERIAKVLQHRPAGFSHGDSVPVPLDLVHAWDDHELEIVLHAQGAGIVSFDGDQQNRFAPDTIEIYPAHHLHKQSMLRGGVDHFLRIKACPGIDELLTASIYLPTPVDAGLQQDLLRLSRIRTGERLRLSEQVECDHRVTALLLALLGRPERRLLPAPPRPDSRLARAARDYVRAHATTVEFLEDVARHLAVSHDHLRHEFKRAYGHSLVRELMERRVELACEHLAAGDEPLGIIAQRCGFASAGYFCRVFRQLRGVAPGAWRSRKMPDPTRR